MQSACTQTPLIPLQDDDATATAARGEESGFFGVGMFKMPNIELPRVAMGFGGMFSDEDVQQKDHAAEDPPDPESSSFFGTIASFRPFAAEEEASLQPPPKATSCGEKKKKPKKREEEVEEYLYGGPATAQGLLANGGTKQIADYLAKNPDQAPRIQKELSNVSLLGNSMMVREEEDMYTTTTIAPPPPRPERVVACLACTRCVSANVTAPELLQQGGSNAVARYLEANPEKASKIQREMIDMPPLSPKGASQLTKIFYGEM